jgi:PAS domain S-box-containing protein
MPDPLKLEPHHRDLASAIDQLNCGLIGRDIDGTIVFANEIMTRWLGYEPGELMGLPLEKLIPEELDERVTEQLRAVEAGDIRARITVAQRKDFTTFPILLIPNRYPGPDGPFFNVVIELSTVQTAKPVGASQSETVRSSLERIALELQTIGLTSVMATQTVVAIDHPDLVSLTDREREVLIHLVAGQRVPAIAADLHISQHTVRNHLKSIYRQLGVSNQSELIERIRSLDAPKT